MSTKALFLIGCALATAGGIYTVLGITPSPGAFWLSWFVWYLAAAAWLRRDANNRRVALAYDWGWLFGLGWPLLWMWYARRTGRGWGATIALVALPGAFIFGAAWGLVLRTLLFRLP
jgi:hypothetical protein